MCARSLRPDHLFECLESGGIHSEEHLTWVDFDNDGDQDLVVSTGICCNIQFMENIGGKLYNRTTQWGFSGDADQGGRMPIWFDMKRDRVLETTLLTFYGAPLLKQDSTGTARTAPAMRATTTSSPC